MFKTRGGFLGFLLGLLLIVGLLLVPHLVPWDFGYGAGLDWPVFLIVLAFLLGAGVLSLVLWLAGRLIQGAASWREGRVILAAILIAFTANTLYMFLVDLFGLRSGSRALVAVLGVPVIYGNLGAVLGRTSLEDSMLNILAGALTTMGAGFIIVALIRGW